MAESSLSSPLTWCADYEIGIQDIDCEHAQLFEKFGVFVLAQKNGIEDAIISDLLISLERYADLHFVHEEQIMRDLGYPDLASHQLQHKAGREMLTSIVSAFHAGAGVGDTLYEFFQDWLLQHVLKSDQKIRDYLKNKA